MHCLSFMSVGRVMLQLRLVSFKYNERKCHVVESIPWISKTEPTHWADSSDDVRNSKDVIVVAISSDSISAESPRTEFRVQEYFFKSELPGNGQQGIKDIYGKDLFSSEA